MHSYTLYETVSKKSQSLPGVHLIPGRTSSHLRTRSAASTSNGTSQTTEESFNNNNARMSPYSIASNPTPDLRHYGSSNFDDISLSPTHSVEQHHKSCSDMSTQTDDLPSSSMNIPGPLRKKLATVIGSPSKIPRPTIQRSRTMELPSSSKLKRRNSTNSNDRSSGSNDNNAPRILREKSQPNMRRQKSDLTGQRSKYKLGSTASPRRKRESHFMK